MKSGYTLNSNHRDWHYLTDLIIQEARAGLRAEATRGYLGVMWWVIEPVLYMTVFYIAFAHVLGRGDENYVTFLLTGLIMWKWFHATLSIGSNSLVANAGLMNQIYVPKIVFPLTTVAVNTFKFVFILVILLVFLQFTSAVVSRAWLLLPVLMGIQLLLIAAITCLLAAVIPFFPDLKGIFDNVLMMLLFLSGVFYDIGNLPAGMKGYMMLNPMAVMIAMYRKVLLYGTPPDWLPLTGVVLFSAGVLILAVWILRRFDRVYPKIVV
ncbi:MAG: ABC transporter permease [Thermodesulfobacteriota bacterium]